ncbi:regulatory protein RecX [Novispirillum itersonii]|uniref:Regulatory protein RecX n=1 Tax=Novispirillum itersonii TaxID=189 RepID=A0A7W9ZIA6_NOVIT|nr:regulatory protein RecX [Novispirillum itersonii]MBB6212017.1 regulatory protein [Novispirillum itersonii]
MAQTVQTNDSGRKPETDGAKRAVKVPRKVSPASLRNAALYYLQRFSASRSAVAQVLRRKARRSLDHHGGDPAEVEGWIEALLTDLERLGLLNDQAFAEGRVRSLSGRGTSQRGIRMALGRKGVAAEVIDQALERVAEETGVEDPRLRDLQAAAAYARRRRLGPWRDGAAREDRRERDMAALARQGFSHDIARRVIDADSPDALDDEIAGG